MDLIKTIEYLHKKPLLFRLLASVVVPGKINNEFRYNRDLTLFCIKLYCDTLDRFKSSIWHSVFFPSEIFHSMKISPFVLEMSSTILAKFDLAGKLISKIEMTGLTRELCSFQKCVAGGFHTGLIPEPKMLLTSSEICDSSRKIGEFFSEKFSSPHYYLDVPFEFNRSSVYYVKEQLTELIKWLEVNTGKTFCEKKLGQSIKYSNLQRRNLLKVMELRQKYPGIMGSRPVFGLFNFNLAFGTSDGLRISENLYNELKKKSGHYKPPKNLIRLLWLHFTPFYKEYFTELLERNQQVSVVFEEMNNIYWEEISEEDPLEGLARKILSSPFRGSLKDRMEKINNLCELFNVDGVIHFSQFGCRQANGGVRIIKDELKKKNIPLLELSSDCIDKRNYSQGQLRTRLEAFIELFD